jgi:DNA-directed RNA polymerase subunit RPC12/RpoP
VIIPRREEDQNGMDKKTVFYQCNTCGRVNRVDDKHRPKDDAIYVEVYCPHCKQWTRQLYCYDEEDDLSIYVDINLDYKIYN